ncbi:MAG: isoprenylcysteine carboxylmethyltransferase family protein [Planctomycetota bacterium]
MVPSQRIPSQRVVDLSIGISILGWATAGTWSNFGQRPFAILLATSLLHLMVGVLFLVRSRAEKQGDLRACLIAVPAVLVGGWVFRFAPQQWNIASQVLFMIGSGLAILSFAFLGRCFAILPAIRGTVTNGPFSFIRHPAYLGELAMVAACIFAVPPNWKQPIILVLTIAFFIARIQAEECLLLTDDAYRKYSEKVHWRLVPYVW